MPKPSVPPRSSRTSSDRVPGAVDPVEDPLRLRPEGPPRLGEDDPATDPGQQLDAELGLELPHLLGERGLRDEERARGRRERAVLGGCEEVAELLESHRISLWIIEITCSTAYRSATRTFEAWRRAVASRASAWRSAWRRASRSPCSRCSARWRWTAGRRSCRCSAGATCSRPSCSPWSRGRGLRAMPWRVAAIAFGLGLVLYTADSFLFYAALERTSAPLASLLHYAHLALVVGAAAFLGRERLDARRLAALVAHPRRGRARGGWRGRSGRCRDDAGAARRCGVRGLHPRLRPAAPGRRPDRLRDRPHRRRRDGVPRSSAASRAPSGLWEARQGSPP